MFSCIMCPLDPWLFICWHMVVVGWGGPALCGRLRYSRRADYKPKAWRLGKKQLGRGGRLTNSGYSNLMAEWTRRYSSLMIELASYMLVFQSNDWVDLLYIGIPVWWFIGLGGGNPTIWLCSRGYSSLMNDWAQHACSFMICVLCGGTLEETH